MSSGKLISDEYQAEQSRMHRDIEGYGVECLRYGEAVANLAMNSKSVDMLDYGSGKGRIVDVVTPHLGNWPLTINLYDPGIPALSAAPSPADMVTCIDVLEHVEPEFTENVIADLHRLTKRLAFITIGLTPAAKVLSDGRNAHINLRPSNEWLLLLLDKFFIHSFKDIKRSAIFIGEPK